MGQPRRSKAEETPFRASIRLGRWAGVEVGAHWSVLVAVALFAALLAGSQLPHSAPGQTSAAYWLVGSITAVVFLVTLLVHELAHAVTARHYGMPVKRITLWMLGGFTELGGEPSNARSDAMIAGAGPAASLLIGAAAGAAVMWLGSDTLVMVALAWLAGVNVILGVFNLMPGAPLDGGRLLRAAIWWRTGDRRRAVEFSTRAGRALGVAMIAIGLLQTLLGGYAGLWLAAIGWFIMSSATGERLARSAEELHGLQVHDVMAAAPAAIPQWWTVEEFLQRLDSAYARQPAFPLIDFEGHTVGLVTAADLDRVPRDDRETRRMRDVPHPARLLMARPNAAVSDLVAVLALRGGTAVVVDEESRPLGLVTTEDVAHATRLTEAGWTPHTVHDDDPVVDRPAAHNTDDEMGMSGAR